MLIHGDCLTELSQVPDASVDMVFADLPYGVTHNKWDVVIPFEPLWCELLRVGTPRCAFVFTATLPFMSTLVQSKLALFRYDLVWAKTHGTGFANVNYRPNTAHENIAVFSRATCNPMSKLRITYNPQKTYGKPYKQRAGKSVRANNGTGLHKNTLTDNLGDRHPLSIVTASSDRPRRHPTQKPVALLEWLIKTYSNPGETILDPTMGSGTTGVACKATGREFIGIEKDAQYFEVASKRIAEAVAA